MAQSLILSTALLQNREVFVDSYNIFKKRTDTQYVSVRFFRLRRSYELRYDVLRTV